MRHLLDVPYGTQYYRAPSPHSDEWERDLKAIAEGGLNMVKFWVQWRWNNPTEKDFHFDDIDRLMELAHHFGLKVMLNTIFDAAPGWIYSTYPDASMVTLDGFHVGPQTQPHRQIGGLGYCLNHEKVTSHQFQFLRETVKRYRDHPALTIWNVGSEPELTSSIAELRLYADDATKMGDMLCYCDCCREKFPRWLQNKYGEIEKLNETWNRNYRSFEEVEVPKSRNTFNDFIDWRMFFVHTLGENVRRRFEVAREEDAGRHPLMCHHVFIQGFPITSTANDPWNVGQYGDLHGCTQMDDPMMIDMLRSCAKDKPVISAEMLMMPGYTLDLHRTVDANDIKRLIFRGLAANLKGFIFWQYRPEILGREAPTWGLTQLDGSETPRLRAFFEVGEVLQQNASLILDAEPPRAEIALLYCPENQIFAWASTGSEKTATDALLGTHRALYQRNYTVDFIHPCEFGSDILDNYKVVIIPFPYCLPGPICRKLEAWVKAGGVLIGESYFGGWNLEKGHHEKTVPGHGLHQVFQARQDRVEPADEEGAVYIEMVENLPNIGRGEKVKGALVKEILQPEGARVLAHFDTGEPAVTMAEYGQGKAILIGSYVATPFHRENYQPNGNLLAGLVTLTTEIERPLVHGVDDIRVDLLTDSASRMMLILQNLSNKPARADITLPVSAMPVLKEQFSGEELHPNRTDKEGHSVIRASLAAKQVKVYCG